MIQVKTWASHIVCTHWLSSLSSWPNSICQPSWQPSPTLSDTCTSCRRSAQSWDLCLVNLLRLVNNQKRQQKAQKGRKIFTVLLMKQNISNIGKPFKLTFKLHLNIAQTRVYVVSKEWLVYISITNILVNISLMWITADFINMWNRKIFHAHTRAL